MGAMEPKLSTGHDGGVKKNKVLPYRVLHNSASRGHPRIRPQNSKIILRSSVIISDKRRIKAILSEISLSEISGRGPHKREINISDNLAEIIRD